MNLYFSYFSWHVSKSMYVVCVVCIYKYKYMYIHDMIDMRRFKYICIYIDIICMYIYIDMILQLKSIIFVYSTSIMSRDAAWFCRSSSLPAALQMHHGHGIFRSTGQKKHQRIWRCYKPRKIRWNDSHVQNEVWKWRWNIFQKIFTCLLFMGVWKSNIFLNLAFDVFFRYIMNLIANLGGEKLPANDGVSEMHGFWVFCKGRCKQSLTQYEPEFYRKNQLPNHWKLQVNSTITRWVLGQIGWTQQPFGQTKMIWFRNIYIYI